MARYDKFMALLALLMVIGFLYREFYPRESKIQTVIRQTKKSQQRSVVSTLDAEKSKEVKADASPKTKIVEKVVEKIVEKVIVKNETIRIPPEDLFDEMYDIITTEQIAAAMFKYALTPTYTCKKEIHMGHAPPKDGGWDLCLDVEVTPQSCIVYSIGISNNWSFDNDAVKYGCDVYSFDPTIGLSDHKRSEHHWFYNMGLWHENVERHFDHRARNGSRYKDHWTCRTADYIRKMLNHEDRPIDMLKMDIEGSEHKVFPQMLESGILNHVKQFAFELHMGVGETKQRRWHLYRALETLMRSYGFQLWKMHPNESVKPDNFGEVAGMHPCCHDLSWINPKFIKAGQ
ncbi:probable methyltransferase-like protein 24 isoform X1 [Ptychodera flava]|uniref:probable methyltransferase-like protein 24 isoform X1 n=1 Tax=Ptychodera flava TaxID=63121 RepID=UPI00396A536C